MSARALRIFFAGSAAVIVGLALALPGEAFYTGDSGVKLLQVQNLIAQDYSSVTLEYPGRDLDPDSKISPFDLKPSMYIREGRNYSVFPVAFPFLSALLFQGLGWPGLYILPVVSALLCLPLIFIIGRRFLPERWALAAMLAAVFLTPFLFYSLTFWEHVPATALFLAGVALMLDPRKQALRSLAAGAVLGLAVWLRTEMLILGAGLLVVVFTQGPSRRKVFLAGGAFVLLVAALLVFNLQVYGGWLNHAALNLEVTGDGGVSLSWTERFDQLRRSLVGLNAPQTLPRSRAGWEATMGLIREDPVLEWSVAGVCLWMLALGLVATLQKPAPAGRWWGRGVLLGCLALCGVSGYYLLTQFQDHSALVNVLPSGGLFGFSPLLALALALPCREGAGRRVGGLIILALVSALVISLMAPNDGGIRFGARYLLPLMPLLAIGAFVVAERLSRLSRPAVLGVVLGLAVLVSAGVQVRGLWILNEKRALNRELTLRVRSADARRIVIDRWWMIAGVSPLMDRSKLHVVQNPGNLAELVRRMRILQEEKLLLCLHGEVTDLPLSSDRLGVRITDRKVITRPSSTYFGFTLFTLEIVEPR